MAVPVRAPFLIHVLCLLLPLAFSSAKPGCQTHCGNLAVPFPFGIGPNCSIDPDFNISCNTSTNPPKAYLHILNDFTDSYNLEVTRIFGSKVRVKYQNLGVAGHNSSDHEGRNDGVVNYHDAISLFGTPFTLSDDNLLTAIGCDDLVTFLGTRNASSAGCVSYCEDGKDSRKGSCPDNGNGYSAGTGCCRMPIPRGASFLVVVLADIHYTWRATKLFPCSFAFIREKMMNRSQSWFSYRLDDLQNPTTFRHNNPEAISTSLVLDWKIWRMNCSQAQRSSTTFACKQNSICVDFDAHVGGYNCKCRDGYKGNPYLTGADGCQDIDECKSPITNPCEFKCINTRGGFNCSCPNGYRGDGRNDRVGCIKLPLSKMIIVSIGLASGMGFLLLLAICLWSQKAFQKRKNKKLRDKYFKRNGGLLLQQQTNDGTLGKTKLFPAKELEKATDHFSESRILGQGGQGTVYKGMLSDGKIAAIKKSKLIDEDQLQQFINEVAILSQINHRNVVKLLGCCLETEVPILVYEFVPNGTLFDLIHDKNTEFPISWDMRLKIAADISGALAYLHSASSIPIYHRDIKSSNILLDEKYVAKVSDFGISRLVAVDQTHLTTMVKGTFGYFDPEYFQSNQFTEKSDVYSFGVVLVELLTGLRPIVVTRTEEERSLAMRFLLSMETNSLNMILDAQVSEQGRKEEVNAVARLAQRCLNLKGRMRPTMKEIATELESVRISQVPSTIEAESQEVRSHKAKTIPFPQSEYKWTISTINATTSNTETDPLMFETL